MIQVKCPVVFVVLDGWGYREQQEGNAILAAKKPNWEQYWQQYPHSLLTGWGEQVGLPAGQMGNSEVGHLTLGAGRVLPQTLTFLDNEIKSDKFFANDRFIDAVRKAVRTNKAVHILGLLSTGGVHSHQHHIQALVKLASQQGAKAIFIHAFLDGRDTAPQSAAASIQALEESCADLQAGKLVSLIGRYYAMDRDQRWERVEQAYNLLTNAESVAHAASAAEGLELAYQRGETDEFVQATVVHQPSESPITIEAGDVVLFANFRADRARQLTRAFTAEHFVDFERHSQPKLAEFVTMIQYAEDLDVTVAYPPKKIINSIGEWVAKKGLKQLRIAETEKYAHVTFFFNGGEEKQFEGEERILIPSPKVKTYDLQPEMNAFSLTEKLVEAVKSKDYDLIVCNYANADMVGHTGNFAATVTAIEALDQCLGQLVEAVQTVNGQLLVTADHGNAELMLSQDGEQAHTAHTCSQVPLLYIGDKYQFNVEQGEFADVAPTLLTLLDLEIPAEMTGLVLLEKV